MEPRDWTELLWIVIIGLAIGGYATALGLGFARLGEQRREDLTTFYQAKRGDKKEREYLDSRKDS